MSRPRLATVWLDGCSGCHMSFLDMDERLLALLAQVDLVYSPLVDVKTYPDNVDIALVEGAVSSTEDIERIQRIRQRTKILVSLGDCAVTSNVPGMRNLVGAKAILDHAYPDNSAPQQIVPRLLEKVVPVHHIVPVDVFIPGCPPSADVIHDAITSLLAGRQPDLSEKTRFGK